MKRPLGFVGASARKALTIRLQGKKGPTFKVYATWYGPRQGWHMAFSPGLNASSVGTFDMHDTPDEIIRAFRERVIELRCDRLRQECYEALNRETTAL